MAITPAGTTLTTSPTALTASGGTPTVTYNWTLEGTVPTGVSLSAATGTTVNLVFGSSTPASSTVTVRCTNGVGPEFTEETYTLNFGGGGGGNSLTIVTTTLPNGSETVVYPTTNITATSTGTTGPNYTWSVSAGTLPPGLTLDTAATGLTTTISGTPTTAGTYNFTVQITDGTNSDTQSFQVDISAAGALVITTSSLAAGTQGAAYSANITAINGVGNHTWSISAGTLPTGLSLGASTTATVSISGTPTQTGTFPITVQVTDSTVPTAQTDTQAFSLVINASSPPPSLGGGGGGGGGGGCAATGGNSYWMFAIGLLAMLGFALRMRARRE
ncbi:MAG: putative Ig domain-containing protein [Planctomycetes bacterium]|nr:putative Ig domain-containing protein [Planctomycetota bacterium]